MTTAAAESFESKVQQLVASGNLESWSALLEDPAGDFRQNLELEGIGPVVSAVVAASVESVTTVIKAFMTANLPGQLFSLLDESRKLKAEWSNNKHIENLLIMTAMKHCPQEVERLVGELMQIDSVDVAKILVSDAYKMFREARILCNIRGVDPSLVLSEWPPEK